MKRMNICKTLNAVALPGGTIMASSALAQTQGGSGYGMGSGMMGGYGPSWMGSGYGGILGLVLLVIVVAGLVGWFVAKKRKQRPIHCSVIKRRQFMYGLSTRVKLPFNTTITIVTKALKQEGFGVLIDIDVKSGSLVAETLAPVKGRRRPEYPASNRLCSPPH
jgi:uncharacterized membrane protein